jgi:ElaB/YqjD/DUF883 family membrane-anchored ribosome-binding protein
MGDHYVPRYYLKGFSQNDGKTIYVYDKTERRCFTTQVKSITNETDFYSPEVEEYLANTIENPANDVLKKIRDRVEISPGDKRTLSAYMTCMMKRVPKGKEKLKELAPDTAEAVRQRIDSLLNVAAAAQPEKNEFIQKRRAEIGEIIDKYAKDPPKEIWLTNMPPEKSPRVLAALSSMAWRFLTFDEYPAFLTSDNPLFFFTSMGIGNQESEVTFPISSHIALWATWRLDLKEGYFPTNSQVVKELSRRTCSVATRYAFHSQGEDWVLPLLTKGRWQLNRLR